MAQDFGESQRCTETCNEGRRMARQGRFMFRKTPRWPTDEELLGQPDDGCNNRGRQVDEPVNATSPAMDWLAETQSSSGRNRHGYPSQADLP